MTVVTLAVGTYTLTERTVAGGGLTELRLLRFLQVILKILGGYTAFPLRHRHNFWGFLFSSVLFYCHHMLYLAGVTAGECCSVVFAIHLLSRATSLEQIGNYRESLSTC